MMKGIFVLLLFTAWNANAAELGMNFYGFSYHPDEGDSNGNRFHSWNPGAGAQFTFIEKGRHKLLIDGGIYRNSSAHRTEYVAAGYRFRLIAGLEAGPVLALYHSPDQNSGKTFLAPVLVLAYRFKRVTFQVVPIPKYKDVNRNAAVGMYVTICLYRRRPVGS